jgi:hypothetical protein
MSDKQYVVSKLMDPKSRRRYSVAVDKRGNEVDLETIVEEDRRAVLKKYGKLHPTLYDLIARSTSKTPIPTAIWLNVEEKKIDKSKFELDASIEPPEQLIVYRKQNRTAQNRLIETLKGQYGIEGVTALAGAPVLLAKLSPKQIQELERQEAISAIFLHEPEGILDISASMAISRADEVIAAGWRGTGVRVAVWEDGADDERNLSIASRFSTTPTTSGHARMTTGIIKNRNRLFTTITGRPVYGGYAPGSRVYAANTKDVTALDWAITKMSCRVVNQSFHRPSEPASGNLSFDDTYKDYLIIHYPYPTIVHAAGNYWMGDPDGINPPADEFVNHKGYNSLSVGNHNDTATAMDGSSVFRNPETTMGDRELPEICANGTDVSVVGLTDGGTSFASPAVAGSVALLQSVDTTLAYWPEGNRAILLAGAVNVRGLTWPDAMGGGFDQFDGSAALDIQESAKIAQHRVGPNNEGQQRGWDVGTFRSGDFEREEWRHLYRIKMPTFGTFRRIKVALAWNTDPTASGHMAANPPTDYDLSVFDEAGALVSSSASYDNSYEIVDFLGDPGRTYIIRVHKAWGDEGSYFGIAWSIRTRSLLREVVLP